MRRFATGIWGVLLVGWAGAALAGECGGDVPCACGDTVTRSTVLTRDIGPCPSTGLEVRGSNIVLDCAWHTVRGTGPATKDKPATSWYGIHLDPATESEVRNCVVTGFKRGIRINGGHGNRIIGNDAYGNWGYGIEIAGGSTGNLIQGNRIGRPAADKVVRPDEGIHNGSNSHDTTILENVIYDAKAENIYILRSNRIRIISNLVAETEGAGIFLKHAHGAHVANNTVLNGSITVRGDSSGNLFEANTISEGRGYLFEAYQDKDSDPSPGYWTFPRRNRVVGGRVEQPITIPNTSIKPCLRFEGSYKNDVQGLALDPTCTPPSHTPDGGQESVANVVNTVPLP